MNRQELVSIASELRKIGNEAQKVLGCGFNEVIFQNALAIEFRKRKIEYLKEVNIEIFYKGESVGVDRPDFFITKINSMDAPILLELKIADKISDSHRTQLKSYCTSLPKNSNPALKGFAGGVLMAFPQNDLEGLAQVKVFLVDPDFSCLVDDQQEEDGKLAAEKLKHREGKKTGKRKGA